MGGRSPCEVRGVQSRQEHGPYRLGRPFASHQFDEAEAVGLNEDAVAIAIAMGSG
jgi:hypothetical protein